MARATFKAFLAALAAAGLLAAILAGGGGGGRREGDGGRNSNGRRDEAAFVEPRFEDFPVAERLDGPPKAPDLSSHDDARLYRTTLRAAAAKGPTFAGVYAVAVIGCGTNCSLTALIDLRDGRVHFAPFVASLGVDYRLDSSLMVENVPDAFMKVADPSARYGPTAEDVAAERALYGGSTWRTFRYGEWTVVARRP
jgi:hypothetical protein